jgi:hypothetical protein
MYSCIDRSCVSLREGFILLPTRPSENGSGEIKSDARDLSAIIHSSLQSLTASHLISPLPNPERIDVYKKEKAGGHKRLVTPGIARLGSGIPPRVVWAYIFIIPKSII